MVFAETEPNNADAVGETNAITFPAAVTGAMPGLGAWLLGVPLGLLTTAILWINEIPDAKSDASVGKNNLVVTLGNEGARWGYVAVVATAFLAQGLLVILGHLPVVGLAAFLALPLALRAFVVLFKHLNDRGLVVANKSTISMHMVFGLALAVAVAFG